MAFCMPDPSADLVRDVGRAVHSGGTPDTQPRRDDGSKGPIHLHPPATRGETLPIRVLIVDDYALIRIGLRSVLAADSQVEVVGEAQDGREAVTMAQALQPDVVLMDVRMPNMGGLEATRALREVCPGANVLILTSFEDEAILLEAVDAGARGFVLKAGTEQRLRSAVRDAAKGTFPVDPQLLGALLTTHTVQSRPIQPTNLTGTLSPREREVLTLLARGMSNRQIARALVITLNTAKVHVDHILAKLGVRDRTQAAIRGIELGYVTRRS